MKIYMTEKQLKKTLGTFLVSTFVFLALALLFSFLLIKSSVDDLKVEVSSLRLNVEDLMTLRSDVEDLRSNVEERLPPSPHSKSGLEPTTSFQEPSSENSFGSEDP